MSDQKIFPLCDYDLAATLTSGQAFRWHAHENGWAGIIAKNWVHLESTPNGLIARTVTPISDWRWLTHYLQLDLDLQPVLASFPNDDSMRAAVHATPGLRLLRQDYWECLASFILSSTKQIVQIRQIVSLLCERYGEPVSVPAGYALMYSFPSAERLARLTEADLRACKMGFRAPYLLATAKAIVSGSLDLAALQSFTHAQARAALVELPGVGPKIADCVLLFAYGFPEAFPVDVWVMKALRELYFPRRQPSRARLLKFIATYFGPHAGYAQQYLFHYMRTRPRVAPEKSLIAAREKIARRK